MGNVLSSVAGASCCCRGWAWKDHFALARDRLEDDGILCQWVPMYEMSARDFLIILRSFVHVFPRSALFFTGLDTLMLGFKGEMRLDPAVVRSKFEIPAVSNSLAEIGFTAPEVIRSMFIADMAKGEDLVGPGPLQSIGTRPTTGGQPAGPASRPDSCAQQVQALE